MSDNSEVSFSDSENNIQEKTDESKVSDQEYDHIYHMSEFSSLSEIDIIPEDKSEVKLEITLSTYKLKEIKAYYERVYGSDDTEISIMLHEVFRDFLINQSNIVSEHGELLFGGKKPRKDVLEKLEKISEQFELSKSFPTLTRSQINEAISIVLGTIDERTKKKYYQCIIHFTETITGQSNSFWHNLEGLNSKIRNELYSR